MWTPQSGQMLICRAPHCNFTLKYKGGAFKTPLLIIKALTLRSLVCCSSVLEFIYAGEGKSPHGRDIGRIYILTSKASERERVPNYSLCACLSRNIHVLLHVVTSESTSINSLTKN